MPGPGSKRMNPYGLVDAASTTSQMSIPIRSARIAISLTSAMLTERKMFSSSFVSSAASGLDTRTICVAHPAVQRRGAVGALAGHPADHLRRVAQRVVGPPGIDALGRERDVQVVADAQPGLLEQRHEPLARRAGIGRRLEHDELPGCSTCAERAGRRQTRGPRSGSRLRRQRRRDADDHGLGAGRAAVARVALIDPQHGRSRSDGMSSMYDSPAATAATFAVDVDRDDLARRPRRRRRRAAGPRTPGQSHRQS